MNTIKYINPTNGEVKSVRVAQPAYAQMVSRWNGLLSPRRGTVSEVDALMNRMGFVRAGLRRGKKANVTAFRVTATREDAK